MPFSTRLLSVCIFALLPLSLLSADGNASRGRRTFTNQCAACHASTAENRLTGPALSGVVGRKAGTLDGFAFSDAMKKSGLTWDAATLEKYLASPTTVVPGTTMTFSVTAAPARADVIAFLNTLTPATAAAPESAK